jgi:hypothetical protein
MLPRSSLPLALALATSVAACRAKAPEAAPPATAPTPTAAAGASDAGSAAPEPRDGGVAGKGPGTVQKQPPTPCSPHVDATDPDYKFSPVESVYRLVKSGDKEVAEILVLDGPGACTFEQRKPAAYQGFTLRLELPGPNDNHHFVLGEEKAAAQASFVAPGKGGAVGVTAVKGGIVDLMERRGDVLAIGFNVKTPAGDAFGCFEAKPCP